MGSGWRVRKGATIAGLTGGWIRHTELLGIEVEGINNLLGRLNALNMASRR